MIPDFPLEGRLAESLFHERGPYRASLLFRNTFPQAIVNDPEVKRVDYLQVWTGELRSNEVSLEVK